MLRLKIFLKCSTKKLSFINKYINYSGFDFLLNLKNELNKQAKIIFKYILIFIKFQFKNLNLINILKFLKLKKILILPSKILKRKRFRAKGRVFDIHKKNSFIIFYFDKINSNSFLNNNSSIIWEKK